MQKKTEVYLYGKNPTPEKGIVTYKHWSKKERFFRGFKLSSKISLLLILVVLPFAIMEPFLFMIWGSIVFFVIIGLLGPLMHLLFFSEEVTFFSVKAKCPYCNNPSELGPYLNRKFLKEFTVLCSSCGEVVRATQKTDKFN